MEVISTMPKLLGNVEMGVRRWSGLKNQFQFQPQFQLQPQLQRVNGENQLQPQLQFQLQFQLQRGNGKKQFQLSMTLICLRFKSQGLSR